ncbi:MAG: hypothetical protein KatS3mg105_3263 [Gemmatales bacterium]|nr:MAG: hypothetical protein KatS3mg105_3263 [Gemmatales bacterium]
MSTDSQMLVSLAAEGIGGVVTGCADILGPGRTTNDAIAPKAINLFGPRIVERWMTGLKEKPKEERLRILSSLVECPLEQIRSVATESIERLAANAKPEDRAIAIEYLSAIPLAVKRSMIQDPETGVLTLPTTRAADDGQLMIRLLPTDAPPFPINTELPGTPYILEELLGIGGFGAVYKARNRFEQHQHPRAIKFCLDASMVATLHRERTILDRLMQLMQEKEAEWSEHIVRLWGHSLDANPPFLIYEYAAGGDLTTYLQVTRQKTGRGFRPATAFDLIAQVTKGLAFAHSQGMVHRDLKPANVLISGSRIKVTDFGIGGVVASHAVRGINTIGASPISQMSAVDQARLFRGSGTPLYMSPEQRRGDQPDPRHDLYSLGVMWYQLLVGDVTRELHPGWLDELMEEYQTPKEHIDIIQRCVGYFKKRPANAGELLAIMTGSTKAAPIPASTSPPAAAPSQQSPAKNEFERKHVEAEFEQYHKQLVELIERDAFKEARQLVTAMLELKPGDKETVSVRNFLDEKLSIPLEEIHVFAEHKGWVRSVACSPDGTLAVSGGDDGGADHLGYRWPKTTRRPRRT